MIKTACYVVVAVVLVVLVAYLIYTESKKQKAKEKFISNLTDELELMVGSITEICENIEAIANNYEINCSFDMKPKNQDKPEE